MSFVAEGPSRADNFDRATAARWLLVEAIVLGAFGDATLRHSPLGLGWALWIAGIALTVVALARRLSRPVSREQRLWLTLAALSAALAAWRDSEMLQFANFVATFAAFAMVSVSMAGEGRMSVFAARIRDLILAMRTAAVDAIAGAATLMSREAALGTSMQGIVSDRLPAIRAVLITTPVVIILGKLLGSADPAFAALFRLPDTSLRTAASHIAFAAFLAWLSAGWMRGLFMSEAAATRGPFRTTLGHVEVTTVLSALNALFGLFVLMQLRWLFGGNAVVQETMGLTAAQYARSGFFELIIVAALTLPILLVTRVLVEHDAAGTRRHSQLALPIVVLLGAIMVSAVSRMVLYVRLFGLTTDRLYALAFMAWLAGVLFVLATTVLRGHARRFAAYCVLSAYAVLGALSVANPDAAVARFETTRAFVERPADFAYLSRLSGDAMPVVAPALATAEPGPTACKAATRVAGHYARVTADGVTGYNVGERAGRRAVLDALTPHSLRRLCGSSTTSPSASLSR